MPEENLTAKITVDTSAVAPAVAKAKSELNKLKDKTVTIRVKTAKGGSGRAGKGASSGSGVNLGSLGKNASSAAAALHELAKTARTLHRAMERFRTAMDNAAKSGKRYAKKASSANSAAAPGDAKSANAQDSKEKKSRKDQLAASRENMGQLRSLAKAFGFLIITTQLLRTAFNKLSESLATPAGYFAAGAITGLGAERIQQWKWALTPWGGGKGGGIADMLALQKNIEAAQRGEQPFGTEAIQLLGGNRLAIRPGMTPEEFIDQIAPRLQELELGKAMAAGRAAGLSEPMIAFLREYGANWRQEVDRQLKYFDENAAKDSATAQRGYDQTKEAADAFINPLARKIGNWLDGNMDLQKLIGAGGTIIGTLLDIFKLLTTYLIVREIFRRFPPFGGGKPGGGGGGGSGFWIFPPLIRQVDSPAEKEPEKSPEPEPIPEPEQQPVLTRTPDAETQRERFARWLIRSSGGEVPEGESAQKFFDSEPLGNQNEVDAINAGLIALLTLATAVATAPVAAPAAATAVVVPPGFFEGFFDSIRNLFKTDEEKKKEEEEQEKYRQSIEGVRAYADFPSDTPLNYMDNSSARQLGSAAGRGETTVEVGGVVINIHAPTGDAKDIQNAVARGAGGASEILQQQFEELDRENASPYYA